MRKQIFDVVPTYVGVDRLRPACAGIRACCPHVCGGGPGVRGGSLMAAELSPRMWGWTECVAIIDEEENVVPTYVGVDRCPTPVLPTMSCCPHVCGGGPSGALKSSPSLALSPRMWGWTVRLRSAAHWKAVVPTYVGVDRFLHRRRFVRAGCPHVCGGGPTGKRTTESFPALSPRMWGWTAGGHYPGSCREVVPTYVGVDRQRFKSVQVRHSCPHVCGGGPRFATHENPSQRLSPRMWGWTDLQKQHKNLIIVVPTYVGVDREGVRCPIL